MRSNIVGKCWGKAWIQLKCFSNMCSGRHEASVSCCMTRKFRSTQRLAFCHSLEQDVVKKQTGCDWLPHWAYVCSWSKKGTQIKAVHFHLREEKGEWATILHPLVHPLQNARLMNGWGGGRCMALPVFYVNPPLSIRVQPAWWGLFWFSYVTADARVSADVKTIAPWAEGILNKF